ncbi:MAG: hypothetical protein V2A73_15390, partial [Pseudomonadota bacterium]
GVPCHRRAADCCGENSTSKEEWNKELGTRHKGPGTARPTAFVHTRSACMAGPCHDAPIDTAKGTC